MKTTQTTAARTNEENLVAEICLYGSTQTGGGFIARTRAGQMFGNGEPVAGRTFTETVWRACDDLIAAGVGADGVGPVVVRIFGPGGTHYAECSLTCPPNFGGLAWRNASQFNLVISADAILAAADPN